ncbi:Hypothetical protein NCS54_01214100 [Fusarium falciforme]|uniref:Hypothetical protein n=1 Tax=Fusarium falciforme TaxID=195108 RepID=UPI002300E26C|nr:Hypothetical protein NCS54_01214100 [Fusarium falciforme]WAO94552.1 Hypothetical protein NCS54_01214100 [Fusarium falciforme]
MPFSGWFSRPWRCISGVFGYRRSHVTLNQGRKAQSIVEADHEVVEYHHYCPPGVQQVLASGTSAFIGEVNNSTVLKYPMEPGGDMTRLELEHKILMIVGQHPGIITDKGFTEAGLYLERATNGTILKYLADPNHPSPSLQQRIVWCRQITEAVHHIHAKRVIHCDIQPTNILVDEELHLKLADFQGRYLSEDGEVIFDGWSSEPCRYFCPRDDECEASFSTDLFALGSTIYFIMTGHEVFPDIAYGEAGWDEKVRSRFSAGIFPEDSHACVNITQKCWRQQYSSADEVLKDMRTIEQELI